MDFLMEKLYKSFQPQIKGIRVNFRLELNLEKENTLKMTDYFIKDSLRMVTSMEKVEWLIRMETNLLENFKMVKKSKVILLAIQVIYGVSLYKIKDRDITSGKMENFT